MKKVISIALLFSIFACNVNILAAEGDNVDRQEQSQVGESKNLVSERRLAVDKAFSQFFMGTSEENVKNEHKPKEDLRNEPKSVIDELKKVLKIALVTGGALATCYGTYKIGDKIGLNQDIKSILSAFNNTKILKYLLYGGFIAGSAAILGFISCMYTYVCILANSRY